MHFSPLKISLHRGFTLVEVLVVFVTVALLMLIVIPSLLNRGKKQDDEDKITLATPGPIPTMPPRKVSILPTPVPRGQMIERTGDFDRPRGVAPEANPAAPATPPPAPATPAPAPAPDAN